MTECDLCCKTEWSDMMDCCNVVLCSPCQDEHLEEGCWHSKPDPDLLRDRIREEGRYLYP